MYLPWRCWWNGLKACLALAQVCPAFGLLCAGHEQGGGSGFAQAILQAHEEIHTCKVCCNLTDDELCPVCRSGSRDKSTICVVEEPKDVFALERAGEYNGLYHVLHGAISPLSGVGPDQLKSRSCWPAWTAMWKRSSCHQPHGRGGGHCHVPFPAAQTAGH